MSNRRLDWAVAALVAAAVLLIEARSTISPEFWWQVVSGQGLLDSGFPGTDVLAWPNEGVAWRVHGWLGHVVVAAATSLVGLGGMLPLVAGVMAGAWVLLYRVAPGNPLGRAFLALVAAAATAPFTSADTATLGLVCLAATLAVVESVITGRWPRLAAWALVPLWALWANLDGSIIVGIAYVLLRVLGMRLARSTSDEASDRLGAVIGAGTVGLLATLINPYGVWLWPAAWQQLTGPALDLTSGGRPPDFQLPTVWPWILLVGVVVLAMAFKPPRPLGDLVPFFGLLAAAMISSQFVPAHAMVAVLVGAGVVAVGRRDQAPAALVGVAAAAVVGLGLLVLDGEVRSWSDGQPSAYPVAAVDAVLARGADPGRVFHDLSWGGYLAYRGVPPFHDTRFGVHDPERLGRSAAAVNAFDAWKSVDDEFAPSLVILGADRALVRYLEEVGGWDRVHQDEVASVFVRRET